MTHSFHIVDYAVVIFYLVFTIAMGLVFSKSEKNTEEYFLGGRKMPTFAIAISMYVTLFSAISFVAIPGEAFANGLSLYWPILLSPLSALLGFSLFVKFYFTKDAFTPYAYLEKRYSSGVRLLTSVLFILMRLSYLSVVMYACAKYFKGAAGWPVWQTILIVGVIGVFYTSMGGMKAVVWTDFLQFFILIVGLAVVFYKLFGGADGTIGGTLSYAFENGRGFEILKEPRTFFSFSPYERFTFWLWLLAAMSGITFNYGCDQMTVQRLLSTSSYKEAKKTTIINVIITLPVISMFWLIGLGLFAYYNNTSKVLPENIHPNEVLSYFIMEELPAPVPGLLMAALLAAVMSTIDSGMNSLSAVFVKDVYVSKINKNATGEQELRMSKIMTIVWGAFFIVFGIVLSILSEGIVSSIMEIAGVWGALLGVVAGTFLLGVTNKRIHSGIIYISSAVAVIVLGVFVYLYYTTPVETRISFNVVGTSPFAVMLVLGYLLSIVWPSRQKDKAFGLTLWTYKKSKDGHSNCEHSLDADTIQS